MEAISNQAMTQLLEQAIRAVSNLPEEEQDRIAARLLNEVREEQGEKEAPDWAWQAIRQVTGRATRSLSTDEILALTRESE